jgi:excisionase family DNA binding protein
MVATEQEFLTIDQVAERLQVSYRTVYRLIENGKLRAIRVGDLYRIPLSAFDEFVREGGTR